ncbi:hypothetical protein [Roseibium sp. MMSF_3412]|uniref:hypothetical protein n=1 Tax=Roseibium sp. MMSF_3412 TaxID=3046712 RepID=UPI00273E9625|nr:hypothetical protein [Roseibium sp. MMSF_3412]
MSGKDKKKQDAGEAAPKAGKPTGAGAKGVATSSKEERLAEALRANLRRRKAAAKARKSD